MGGKYAISIGVRKSGPLPALDGAIADAHAFAEWARSCKEPYLTSVITDEEIGKPVTVDRLKAEINRIIEEDITCLLIFYAGHGIAAQGGDYWLLSNYSRDGDEAVNLFQSMRNARRHGIGQIALFSDACRTSLNTAAYVGGRVIFPPPARSGTLSRYDEFLSTDIGDAAQEVTGDALAKSYGIFSKCLLTALHGLEPEAIESRVPRKVLTSTTLANWLEKAVPLQSGKIPGAAVQYPSITTGWRAPKDEYAEFGTSPEFSESLIEMGVSGRKLLDWVSQQKTMGLAERRALRNTARARVAESQTARAKVVDDRTDAYLFASHQALMRRRGNSLTILGAEIIDVVAPDGENVDVGGNGKRWAVQGGNGPLSIALCTVSEQWFPATLLPDFSGTLLVGENGVESLNYAHSRNSHERSLGYRSEERVARWNALLSVGRSVQSAELTDFADEVRQFKHVNPTLGILAAYAYERAGQIDEVASVAWYFLSRNGFVPFDVWALLEAYGDPVQLAAQHDYYLSEQPVVAGGIPLLTRGWSLIDPDQGRSSSLAKLRGGLKDSVWTTFDGEEGVEFAKMIANRRI